MKRSSTFLFAFLFCSLFLIPTRSLLLAAPKAAEKCTTAVVPAYEEVLRARANDQASLDRQPAITAQGLASIDGRMLIQFQNYTLTWSANLGNVTVWSDNQSIPLSYYTDEYGRLAFAGQAMTGTIDLVGSEVHLQFGTSAGQFFWDGHLLSVVAEDGTIETVINMTNPKKCMCKGSNSTDGCSGTNDCLNNAPCTTPGPNGRNSNCGMFAAPLDLATEIIPLPPPN